MFKGEISTSKRRSLWKKILTSDLLLGLSQICSNLHDGIYWLLKIWECFIFIPARAAEMYSCWVFSSDIHAEIFHVHPKFTKKRFILSDIFSSWSSSDVFMPRYFICHRATGAAASIYSTLISQSQYISQYISIYISQSQYIQL